MASFEGGGGERGKARTQREQGLRAHGQGVGQAIPRAVTGSLHIHILAEARPRKLHVHSPRSHVPHTLPPHGYHPTTTLASPQHHPQYRPDINSAPCPPILCHHRRSPIRTNSFAVLHSLLRYANSTSGHHPLHFSIKSLPDQCEASDATRWLLSSVCS
jgi:hypothetical protein